MAQAAPRSAVAQRADRHDDPHSAREALVSAYSSQTINASFYSRATCVKFPSSRSQRHFVQQGFEGLECERLRFELVEAGFLGMSVIFGPVVAGSRDQASSV
jgi:hypothetical protein